MLKIGGKDFFTSIFANLFPFQIDRHTAESRAWVEEMRKNTPISPLQERLRAIRDE